MKFSGHHRVGHRPGPSMGWVGLGQRRWGAPHPIRVYWWCIQNEYFILQCIKKWHWYVVLRDWTFLLFTLYIIDWTIISGTLERLSVSILLLGWVGLGWVGLGVRKWTYNQLWGIILYGPKGRQVWKWLCGGEQVLRCMVMWRLFIYSSRISSWQDWDCTEGLVIDPKPIFF